MQVAITEANVGTDNLIGMDPLFQDFTNGDFSLQDNSPAVDYGRNNLYTDVRGNGPGTDNDLAGNDRLFGTYVDAGAYELQSNSTLTPPSCTAISNPSDGATDIPVTSAIEWDAAADAHGYYITIGTTSGGIDIENRLDVGNVTTYTPSDDFPENTTVYVTIVPYNAEGDATGCAEISFTTETLATAPDCATITGPADGATDVAVDANITWNAVSGADGYYVSIGTTSGGTDIANNVNVIGTSYTPPADLPENTTVYVRIVPYNAEGDATGCAEISFTTETLATAPDCATITGPADGTTDVAVDANITWNAVSGADGYYVSIGTTSGGTDIADNVDISGTSYNPTTDFPEDTEIYVSVIAYNAVGDATGCSEISFTTETLATAPDCATITGPADGATDVAVDANITWNAVSGADGYYVSIGTTSGGTDIADNADISGTTYNPATDFPEDTEIFVSVVPYNAVGPATGCGEISFTTEDTTPAPTVPDCATNIAPANNSTDVAVDANITWDAVSGADGYYVSIGTTSGGTDIADNADISGTTYNPATDFPEDTEIYVSVVPYNAVGPATGCGEISFTTETLATAPGCATIISPVDGATHISISTDIVWSAVANATGYRISIGTTPAGSEIINAADLGNTTTYTPTNNLVANTDYYVRLIPYNTVGDATGCPSIHFRTRLRELPPVTLPDGIFEYDGNIHRLAIVEDLPVDLRVTYSSNNGLRDVGEERVTATITGDGYDTRVLTARLQVMPKSVTVTAIAATKEYGDHDPELWYTVSPELVVGDSITGSLTRAVGEDVAIYAITQGTLALNANYQLSFRDGELAVLPAHLTIHVADTVKMHDGIPFHGGTALQFDGFKFDDSENNLSGSPVFIGDAQGATAVGQYTISLSGYTADNYTITYQSGTLRILPRTFFVPNVITPNGDGKNEAFYVKARNFLHVVNLRIYNRTGQLLYDEEDYQDDFRGGQLLDGTYFYEIEYKETPTSKMKKHKGYLTIIRHIDGSYY